jgi:hypothetical protein
MPNSRAVCSVRCNFDSESAFISSFCIDHDLGHGHARTKSDAIKVCHSQPLQGHGNSVMRKRLELGQYQLDGRRHFHCFRLSMRETSFSNSNEELKCVTCLCAASTRSRCARGRAQLPSKPAKGTLIFRKCQQRRRVPILWPAESRLKGILPTFYNPVLPHVLVDPIINSKISSFEGRISHFFWCFFPTLARLFQEPPHLIVPSLDSMEVDFMFPCFVFAYSLAFILCLHRFCRASFNPGHPGSSWILFNFHFQSSIISNLCNHSLFVYVALLLSACSTLEMELH